MLFPAGHSNHRSKIKISVVIFGIVLLSLNLFGSFPVMAQSQALNGQIEGSVTDANGAAIPNATITVVNIETGASRTVSSGDDGIYRAPLLPLGSYRVTADAANFKKLVREGITLTTGQTATVELVLQPGGVQEVITISGDAPIADVAKIDVGRVMNEREVRNLPLVSRNPYNFSLLQANVTGRPNSEFGVPRINANGYARRTNYQLDGNNNTQADRAGIRLMPISEVFVSEVQLVTNGFAAEFGNTPGLIMNAVTPAGTNALHGSASYRFRRSAFSSRPFNFDPTRPKPGTKVDDVAGAIGGPILRDRWHFYTGGEKVVRNLGGEPGRIISVSQANQAALIAAGVSPSAFPGAYDVAQKSSFFIVRTDLRLNDKNNLVGRVNVFRNAITNNNVGGLTTLERTTNFLDASDSVGLQLISTLSPTVLNEARYQYARRKSRNLPNENSSTAPAVIITGVASFGQPPDANTILPLEVSNQGIDNVTWTHGDHTIKTGVSFNFIDDTRRSGIFAAYTFPSIAAFVAAKNGNNPRSYTNYSETVGNPNIKYYSEFYSFFAQDDWKITSRLKFNYGLRYDLYQVPGGVSDAPLPFSRQFKTDKNNFAPRLGIVYALRGGDRPTVIRASTGFYYEPPYLDIYLRALQNNGNPIFPNFSLSPNSAGSPAYPNRLGTLPTQRRSIDAVSPDYENTVAYHSNIQVEQALSNNFSATLGYIHSSGRHLPVYRNINPINPVATLADGRPVFSSAINSTTRLFPDFNNVLMVESVGNSEYNAGTFSLTKRFSQGYQFSANYTYSHSIDDAPEQNLVASSNLVLSDPTNRRRDRGNSLSDQRHTFVMSFVGRPTFQIENTFLRRLLNDNQVGIITTANSGETFNITANRDLNSDGVAANSDRPLFIGRNTGVTPHQFNVDLRYSRFVPLGERFNVEVFGEFVNLFNVNSIYQINSAGIPVNPDGSLIAPLPDFRRRSPTSLDARQFQLGFKFNF